MSESEFYITLPSNAGMKEYPNNRPGNFKVNLSHKHELHDGVWEIGLSEVQFTHNWRFHTPAFDVLAWQGLYAELQGLHKHRKQAYEKSDSEKRLLDIAETGLALDRHVTAFVQVPSGYWLNEYEFGDMLAARVEAALSQTIGDQGNDRRAYPLPENLKYAKDSVSKKAEFTIDVGKSFCFTTENVHVMEILGLTPSKKSVALEEAGKQVRLYMFLGGDVDNTPLRIAGGFPDLEVMFVYSSVCEEQHIGDQVGNLLKTVPVTVEHGKRQCERYSPPTYTRLRPSTLYCVDIQLLDKTGAEVDFSDANSVNVLQLHVRKRRAAGWC